MNNALVTRQLTGLPGNPKNSTVPAPSGLSKVAKVAGLPGFILTLPKCTVPSFSNIGLTKSASPILTYSDRCTERIVKSDICKSMDVEAIILMRRLQCIIPTAEREGEGEGS